MLALLIDYYRHIIAGNTRLVNAEPTWVPVAKIQDRQAALHMITNLIEQ